MRTSVVAASLVLGIVACKPGHHPPPPELPEPLDQPESKPPGVHDEKLFEGDGGAN